MNHIKDIHPDHIGTYTIGGKARNLFHLREAGLHIPKWIVIPLEELLTCLSAPVPLSTDERPDEAKDNLVIPESTLKEITAYLAPAAFFAVRSSAADEDGSTFSFAGQFESYLFVHPENLAAAIAKVWQSALSDRVHQYRQTNALKPLAGMAVIIQEMIPAEVSGVAFGMNPATGDRRTKVINAVYGLGEGLVSGDLNADLFTVRDTIITSELADKTHQIVLDSAQRGGTRKVAVAPAQQALPCLSHTQIQVISDALHQCQQAFGKPQDIEFAWANNQFYLLQTRPVTTLGTVADRSGDYILWDNSNIVESYPGVTTPLTFSFIRQSYETAYKLFSSFMGVEDTVIHQHERVFAQTLGLINGRVYYNLKTWYHMLAMVPGYSLNARFMEKMMGVKERFDIPDTYRLSKRKAWWRIVKMAVRMYLRFRSMPRKRTAFMQLLDTTIAYYKSIDYNQKNTNELMQLYLSFEKTLLNEWKAPLLNDFFAMIWFGLLQKQCEAYAQQAHPNLHNDLLCGSSDIISTQPIHRSIALATSISSHADLKALFVWHDATTIWKTLSAHTDPAWVSVKKEVDQYIADFGERCVGELKLETISYTQDPTRFIQVLQSYVTTGLTTALTSSQVEETLRTKAEQVMGHLLRGRWLKKIFFNYTLRKTRELVSARENLRYERTRAFGIVREIFSHLGKRFYAEGVTAHARDIFYLTKEEIFAFVEGTAVTQNLQPLVALRKEEFEAYQQLPVPSERFATYGMVYHANDFFSTPFQVTETTAGQLKGIGCCPGRVRAKVRVVRHPSEVTSMNGDILVTSSTDPGWVTLFPSAAGIIVERGSLLSHSAIVSREMGKPCIVSVTGLLKTLKTGDEIEMDGSTGEIRLLKGITDKNECRGE